ncbi:Fur family transcriptional regulator [Yersinia enterocolitica]|nr:Fur family transcriptional regulator [Yersinia enterocolitica]
MKPLKQCQWLILFLTPSAEKAAKSVSKQHKKGDFTQSPDNYI